MGDLARDTAVEACEGGYRAVVSPEWAVWGPNGGFLASLALRAAGSHSALPRPASLTCHYLNVAAFDEVMLEVRTLRASKRGESVRVSMRQGSREILEAMVWLVAEQDGLVHDDAPMPSIPPPDEIPAWTPPDDGERDEAVFPLWYNLEARLLGWPEGQRWEERRPGPPVRQEWCRFRPRATFDDPFVDAARSVIVIDTLMYPAAAMAYGEPMPYMAPSLDLAVWFHRPAFDQEWLLCEATSPVAEAGLVNGTARVWARDGALVASGGQQMLCRPFA